MNFGLFRFMYEGEIKSLSENAPCLNLNSSCFSLFSFFIFNIFILYYLLILRHETLSSTKKCK